VIKNQKWVIQFYQTAEGKIPYVRWFESYDEKTQTKIFTRLNRVQNGNFGDYKVLGDGVYELRFMFGGGIRIDFAIHRNTILLLLCGGDKKS